MTKDEIMKTDAEYLFTADIKPFFPMNANRLRAAVKNGIKQNGEELQTLCSGNRTYIVRNSFIKFMGWV